VFCNIVYQSYSLFLWQVLFSPHNIVKDKLNVKVDPSEIQAIHRIPGKIGEARPVIVKLVKNLKVNGTLIVLYGKTFDEKRIKFDIFDDINNKIAKRH
jgi:hypothetical protein